MTRLKTSGLVLAMGLAAPVLAEVPYHYPAGKTPIAPEIDGKLNDAVWSSVKATRHLVLHNDNSPSAVVTWSKVTYDDDNLYIAFFAQDNDIASQFTQFDDPTYQTDDTVEVFIDPDGDGKNYYELGVTAQAAYDVVIHQPKPWSDDQPWNIAGLEYAVNVEGTLNDASDIDQGMQVEIKIPLASLNYLGNNEYQNRTWRFNLHRAEYSSQADTWMANEWLAWSPIGSFGFHQPEHFGYLHFTDLTLWQAGKAYPRGSKVSYQGQAFEALHYSSAAAPGMAAQDNWRVVSEVPTDFNTTLTYLAGDQVRFNGQVYQANWMTKGQWPGISIDWTVIE